MMVVMINLENIGPNLNKVFWLSLLLFSLVACKNSHKGDLSRQNLYRVPDTADIPQNEFGDLVRYGRELIVRTNEYLGPEGRVGIYLGNRMNCGSCHLDGGTRPFGLSFY